MLNMSAMVRALLIAVIGLTLALMPFGGAEELGGMPHHFPEMKVSASAHATALPDCGKAHSHSSQKPCSSGTICAAGGCITWAGTGLEMFATGCGAQAFVLPERVAVLGLSALPPFEPPRALS